MNSFSVLALTAGDNVYLFFHILTVRQFYLSNDYYGKKEFYIFILLLSLCIASKLFGVFLIFSFLFYHLLNYKCIKKIKVESSVKLTPFYLITIVCFFILVFINFFSNFNLSEKMVSALICELTYLGYFIYLFYQTKKESIVTYNFNVWQFWLIVTSVTFMLVIGISPIYLNLTNILKMFYWSNNVTRVDASTTHWYEMLGTIIIKMGPISCLVLLVSSIILFAYKKYIAQYKKIILFSVITVLVHFVFICIPNFKLNFYPMAIFPFLFLPLFLVLDIASKHNFSNLKKIGLVFVMIISIDNMSRYIYWWPNTQMDGLQFGRTAIGLSRPVIFTFELLGQVDLFDQEVGKYVGESYNQPIMICGRFVPGSDFNYYLSKGLENHLNAKFKREYKVSPFLKDMRKCVFVVTFAIAKVKRELEAKQYKIVKIFNLTEYDFAYLYIKKEFAALE